MKSSIDRQRAVFSKIIEERKESHPKTTDRYISTRGSIKAVDRKFHDGLCRIAKDPGDCISDQRFTYGSPKWCGVHSVVVSS